MSSCFVNLHVDSRACVKLFNVNTACSQPPRSRHPNLFCTRLLRPHEAWPAVFRVFGMCVEETDAGGRV